MDTIGRDASAKKCDRGCNRGEKRWSGGRRIANTGDYVEYRGVGRAVIEELQANQNQGEKGLHV